MTASNYIVPNGTNRETISKALEATYPHRKQWMNMKKPSTTEIVLRFVHLTSYGGDMVLSSISFLSVCSFLNGSVVNLCHLSFPDC